MDTLPSSPGRGSLADLWWQWTPEDPDDSTLDAITFWLPMEDWSSWIGLLDDSQ